MNELELLRGRMALMEQRIRKLEVDQSALSALSEDDRAAQRLAETLGFQVDVLRTPKKLTERRRLAETLRAKNWSWERIARVLHCAEKTARRGFRRGA